ncbi:medium-chain acyl-CoA ligase ACSF2, mitochondrial-like [Saccoglossus kowalevskii]|uniref:Medium-chain acyl-CoA ligase ACSF2, mitochondrial n=1 Tax=Saccoglossus kowalevskii TaxID=10224 RepID=A0ABM0GIE9_SACKO|nr:PREDICTED: acyl-CoA synthetase family member 2, mitochondrial-like [Saccoglossus kowalevskii]
MAQTRLTQSYVHQSCIRPFKNITVGRLLDSAANNFPNREALVFMEDGTRKTFANLHHDVNRISAGLLQLNLKPGDPVAILADENYRFISAEMAAATAGFTSVRILRLVSLDGLKDTLNRIGCKALIVGITYMNQIEVLKNIMSSLETSTSHNLSISELPKLKHIISLLADECPGVINIKELEVLGDNEAARLLLKKVKSETDMDDFHTIVFTSGSTGSPKAVSLTYARHNDYVLFLKNVFDITIDTVKTQPLIFAHQDILVGGSFTFSEGAMLTLGATIVISYPPNNTSSLLKAIHQEQCNIGLLFPEVIYDIANHMNIDEYNVSCFRYPILIGSLFSEQLTKKVSLVTSWELYQAYSSVECGSITYQSHRVPMKERMSTAGYTAMYGELKIVNESNRINAINKPGEICFRGPFLFIKYWGDPEKTREAKSECGWFHTGDDGIMDDKGCLKILGRKDDMIIRGGVNIYPTEIECLFVGHPKIKRLQVVPVPDERFFSEICLCVILVDDVSLTKDELIEHLKGRIHSFKYPRYVLFMKEFPMTKTSKIKRKELAMQAAKILKLNN